MKHELKIWPQYYQAVAEGSKTFEVRKNDRGFQKDDEVILREYNPEIKIEINRSNNWSYPSILGYTGTPELKFKIGYVLPIDAERVVFSLLKVES